MNFNFRVTKSKNWQTKFIGKLFKNSENQVVSLAQAACNKPSIINEKIIPSSLFKYYSPSAQNVQDILKQRIWLSHPKDFNDPFDCKIGYNEERLEKECLIKLLNSVLKNTSHEYFNSVCVGDVDRIKRSILGDYYNYFDSKKESFWKARYDIQKKGPGFDEFIWMHLKESANKADERIKEIQKTNIRVCCFSSRSDKRSLNRQTEMWSHYADNHKGFCVEYDLSSLNNEIYLKESFLGFYNHNKDAYLSERERLITKAGLFPVEYTSTRVNVPTEIMINGFENKKKCTRNINELIYKAYIVKSSNWSYEQEWRLIVDSEISSYYNNKIPFPYIKKIYVGCRAENELIEGLFDVSESLNVPVEFMKMGESKFELKSIGMEIYEHEKKMKECYNPFP